MKKTMFITSIVMVVVLAVALTTSSLAWFAAGGNETVSVTQFQIQAKNNAAAAGLEISNDGSSGWKTTSIDLRDAGEISGGISRDIFVPLVPIGEIDQDGTTEKLDSDDLYNLLRSEMYTAQIKTVDGDVKMAAAPTAGTAFTRDFYVRNTGESATTVTVTLTVAVDDENDMDQRSYNAMMHVALFDETGCVWTAKQDQTAASHTGNVKLLAFSTSETATSFCQPEEAWAANDLMSSVNGQTQLIANLDIVTLSLEAAADTNDDGILDYTPHHLRLIAWFDGDDLTNQNSDTKVNISLDFDLAS